MEVSSAYKQAVMASHPFEEVIAFCPKTQHHHQQQQQQQQQMENQDKKLIKPQPEQALKCPRCDSTNTKFCYYNNYSLSQPRYFCKGCRRYWTQGGSLRNVPVGGGCRKNKRSSSSSSTPSTPKSSATPQDQSLLTNPNTNPLLPLPPLSYDPNDLTLAFATPRQCGPDDHHDHFLLGSLNPSHHHHRINPSGFLDAMKPSCLHQNLYYGFGGNDSSVQEMEAGGGGEEVVVPFEGTTTSSAAATTPAPSHGSYHNKVMDGGEERKMMMGLQWQVGGGDHHGSMGLDLERDYWNGVASSWHGLINSSSLM